MALEVENETKDVPSILRMKEEGARLTEHLNDASVLHKSHIGLVMGILGTEVAKQNAGIINVL
ncbi:putative calcium-transporting ATPase 11, plasma membrane-type [Senna tora]|uniref:Putative calcium-transporting ATPase 11, plasma membrane-type n=1 Tax=Senna tora TaxID=362788 RepID=A0A834WKY0_9FABA|nr:putative calcium-transporting ATPase 11, plasma membrane-type [Senna tora]